jgi:hypothetical protein
VNSSPERKFTGVMALVSDHSRLNESLVYPEHMNNIRQIIKKPVVGE